MPSWLTLKVGAAVLGAAAVLAFVLLAFHWKHVMTERGVELATVCQETRNASHLPRLRCADMPKQIRFMGEAIATLSDALARQKAAAEAMEQETARQQKIAAEAENRAAQRVRGAQAVSDRLAASSRSEARKSAPCEPSEELTEAWR